MRGLNAQLFILLLLSLAMLGCSGAASKKQEGQPNSSAQPQQVASQSQANPAPSPAAPAQPAADPQASEAPAAGKGGPPATEKHRMNMTNYAKVPVTITVNGEWLGQWDQSVDVPLQPVQGKNQLTVELGGEPKNVVTVSIIANRAGQDVNLLTLNFQGQTGTHTYTFVAK
jgi:hypothetical protein